MTRGPVLPCAFCGEPCDSGAPGVFLEVAGWAENRTRGGAHAITMRRNTGRVAHGPCMEAHKVGGHQRTIEQAIAEVEPW